MLDDPALRGVTPPAFNPSDALKRVMDRATELAGDRAARFVTVETMARALLEIEPDVIDEIAPQFGSRLFHRVGRTNELLGNLNQTMAALSAATRTNTQEEQTLVATIDDLTPLVAQLAADDGALKTSVDAVVAALTSAKAGGFTPEQQAALDSAVSGLAQVHTALQADAQEATDAVTPPVPPVNPAPQG
jgi:ABC-type transporter Mla subunit MlaD